MIARLQKEYDEKVAQKEELERKSRMLQLKLERAEALITGLSGELLYLMYHEDLVRNIPVLAVPAWVHPLLGSFWS